MWGLLHSVWSIQLLRTSENQDLSEYYVAVEGAGLNQKGIVVIYF